MTVTRPVAFCKVAQITHFLVVKINNLLLLIEQKTCWVFSLQVGRFFLHQTWRELPALDEFDFPFQLVTHKCKGQKLYIEEKPGYETKTSRFVQINGLAELGMLTLTVPSELSRTSPANSEGDYSEAGLFSNNECT